VFYFHQLHWFISHVICHFDLLGDLRDKGSPDYNITTSNSLPISSATRPVSHCFGGLSGVDETSQLLSLEISLTSVPSSPGAPGPGTLSQPQPQQQQQSFLEYDIRHTLEQFMGTYHRRKIPEYGLLRLAKQFKLQGMEKEAIEYLNTVVSMNSKIVEAYLLLSTMQTLEPNVRLQFIINALMIDPDGYHVSPLLSSISLLPPTRWF
jgi:hypothetical protein